MMEQHAGNPTVEPLQALIGEWSIEAVAPWVADTEMRASVVFEWMTGGQFVVQRWEIPVPEAPDGIAIIGAGQGDGSFLQHYFDSRGVARVYEMSLADGVWKLWRDSPDFSPLSFSQRFTGTFSPDGARIEARWEIARDGECWEHDFDLIYTKIS
jgi:hypothetical protein